MAHCRTRGEQLQNLLTETFKNHPHIGDIRGRGLFRGIELVHDRTNKTPFTSELKLHARIKKNAMAEGLLCYPMGGTVDGKEGDHILLAPPFISSEDEIAMIVERLHRAINTSIESIQ